MNYTFHPENTNHFKMNYTFRPENTKHFRLNYTFRPENTNHFKLNYTFSPENTKHFKMNYTFHPENTKHFKLNYTFCPEKTEQHRGFASKCYYGSPTLSICGCFAFCPIRSIAENKSGQNPLNPQHPHSYLLKFPLIPCSIPQKPLHLCRISNYPKDM